MNPISEDTKKLLADLQSDNADVRYAAWARGGELDADAIPELAKLFGASQPGIRKAGDQALYKLVHSVGKETGGAKRAAVVRGLVNLLGSDQTQWVRTIALRHLSLIGNDTAVPAAAKLMRDPKLQEEAVYCLERIPGKAATAALMESYSAVAVDFKPRVLAALGHRRAEESTELCAQAMASADAAVALAAFKAVARIGRKPAGSLRPLKEDGLSVWQKFDRADALVRYAEEQVKRANPAEAIKLFAEMLQRQEEHLQCAAVIGLSRTGTAEALKLISTKLDSTNNTVRITARKAWDRMMG